MTREEAKKEWANTHPLDLDLDSVIDVIYDELEARTCENCICWDSVEFSVLKTMSYCRFLNVGTKNTFGCNKWESK